MDVVMEEFEAGCKWGQVFAAPRDHAPMNVNPEISPRTRALLDQLPRDSSAAAPEVEHRLVGVRGQIRIHSLAGRIVEHRRIGETDEFAHLERRNRRLARRWHFDTEGTRRGTEE